jgi:vitamin B12 transporter
MATSIAFLPRGGAFNYGEASFQGSRTQEILFMVDGVRVNNRMYNAVTPFDSIPAHMIERIEILEGGQGLFYGTQAVAGAINIVTKSFSEETDGALTIGADTLGSQSMSGYVRTSFGPHRIVAYASSDQSDGYEHYNTEDVQPSSIDRERGYDVFNAGLKYQIDLTEDMRFSAGYQYTDATIDNLYPDRTYESFNQRDEHIFNAKLDVSLGDSVELFVKGYYHLWDSAWTQVAFDPVTSNLTIYYDRAPWRFEDMGINILGRVDLGSAFQLYAGYDYQTVEARDEVIPSIYGSVFQETVHAVFGQIRTSDGFSERLRLTAGFRTNMPEARSLGALSGDPEPTTVWSVTGQYDFTDDLFVRANIGTAFRLPDTYELYAGDPCCETGNPNLEPETSRNFNGSVGGATADGRLNWELIGFYREVENLIAPDAGFVYQNSDSTTEVQGFQVVLNAMLGDSVTTNFSYTNSDAQRGDGGKIDAIPEQLARFGINYDPVGAPFGLGLSAYYIGSVQSTTAVGIIPIGEYALVDLTAYYDLAEGHRISARLQNATDEQYVTTHRRGTPDDPSDPIYAARLMGQPRTFQLRYTYSF